MIYKTFEKNVKKKNEDTNYLFKYYQLRLFKL